MNVLTTICKSLAAAAALMAAALPSAAAAEASTTTTTFAADTTTVLRNPLSGWVMYLGRTWDSDFWIRQGYDAMPTSTGDTVRVSDYATCAYIRTSWASFEPEEGRYAWEDPDSRLMRLIRSVWERGLRIAFRVVIDGRDQGQNTPQYVFDAGAEGYYDPKSPGKNRSPYPDDPVFQEKYAKFLHAMAREFDDPAKVEFIDAYSMGRWGESHSMIYKDASNKEPVFEWIAALATDCFKRVPMLIHYHRMLGDADDDGWGAVPEDAEALIEKAVGMGFSLRHDAFGMTGYYDDWERGQARKWRFVRPIILEGGWITGAHHRYWRDPSGAYREGHAEDVRLGEYEAGREARVNMMDLRINDETRSWFQDVFPLVRSFVAHGGYRLYPERVVAPASIAAGTTARVSTRWVNLGWGYCPTNIPQWHHRYRAAVALLDAGGRPVAVAVDGNSDLSSWLLERPGYCSTPIDLDGVAPGTYRWGVALVDTLAGNRPAIAMAVDPSLVAASGWLPCGEVVVK